MKTPRNDGKHIIFRSPFFPGTYLRLSWGKEYLLGNSLDGKDFIH